MRATGISNGRTILSLFEPQGETMIRPKLLAGLLLASVTMLGLGGCTKVEQVPVVVPADHHDDGHDRDHHPPPQNQHDQRYDNDHPNAPPPQRP